jgi:glutamate/tyrosine decarboxylase-like PLP-dependent enzyme
MAFLTDWDALAAAVETHRARVDAQPVLPSASPAEIRERLVDRFSFTEARPLEEVVRDVASILERGMVHTTHPAYFGLFNPDVHAAAVAAETMVAAFNPQLAAYSHAPGPNEIEAHALNVFRRALGWDDASSATFTGGGSEANHSAVIVGLTARLPDFAERGVDGRRAALYVSAEAHHSFVKIAHACGIGRAAVRVVPTSPGSLAMDPLALRTMISADRAEGRTPVIVVGTAGTTSAGAIDPLAALAEVARTEGLWFHVDAAWGGAALLAPALRHHLSGIEEADSVTLDAHKWLSVPMGTGMFFCRDGAHTRAAFGIQTAYMPAATENLDPYVNTLQWSRRHNGLKLFMTLAALGLGGYAERVSHQAAMADLLARRLREEGWRIVHHSPLAVVTFLPPCEMDLDNLVTKIYNHGQTWISRTQLSGYGPALRACVTNYRTEPEHVETLVRELRSAAESKAYA